MMEEKQVYRIITITSLSFLVIVYLLLFFLQNLILGTVASFFEISSKITHDTIVFILEDTAWGYDSVKTTFSSGIVMMLLIGLFCLVIFYKFREFPGVLKIFFLWGFLVSFSMIFGYILIGGFVSTGFGHVLAWSYVRDTGKMLHVIIALTGLSTLGLVSARMSLLAANSYFNNLTDSNRIRFFIHQFFYPYIFASILFFLIRIPIGSKYEFYDIIVQLSLIIPLLIMFLGIIRYSELMFDEDDKKLYYRKGLIITAILITALYRIGLSFGINL